MTPSRGGWRAFAYVLRRSPLGALVGLSALAFTVSIALHPPEVLGRICGAGGLDGGALAPLFPRLPLPLGLAIAWLLMLGVMMPPLLTQPVAHVWICSFKARRPRALGMFAAGYAGVWLIAGLALSPLAALVGAYAPGPASTLALLLLALVWSSSPLAQAARNRCHRLRRIGAFGWAADRDCLRQGAATAGPCIAACWPWMLVPAAAGPWHLLAMAAVTVLLYLERLAPSGRPLWRTPPAVATLWAFLRPLRDSLRAGPSGTVRLGQLRFD